MALILFAASVALQLVGVLFFAREAYSVIRNYINLAAGAPTVDVKPTVGVLDTVHGDIHNSTVCCLLGLAGTATSVVWLFFIRIQKQV